MFVVSCGKFAHTFHVYVYLIWLKTLAGCSILQNFGYAIIRKCFNLETHVENWFLEFFNSSILAEILRIEIIQLPEIHSGRTLIGVGWSNATDSAFRKEDANEGGIISSGPFFNGECQRICVVLWWIRKLQKPVHRYL